MVQNLTIPDAPPVVTPAAPKAAELFVVPDQVTALVRQSLDVHSLIADRSKTEEWKKINQIDCMLAELPQVKSPLNHVFAPVPDHPELHAYGRSIFMQAGNMYTTRIHLVEHIFVISLGTASVWNDEHGWQLFRALHIGVTKAGTRRVLYIHQDCIWTTFHVTKESDPDKIVDEISYDPMKLGHMDHLDPEKLAAVRANCRTEEWRP